jgi:hypothetical protein
MSTVRKQLAVLLFDPQSARILTLGVVFCGLLVTLLAPGSTICSPPGDGGIGGPGGT